MPESTCYWINGRLLSEHEAVIPVTDHGLLYGDGVFEGIRFYHRHPFRLAAHGEKGDATLCTTFPPIEKGSVPFILHHHRGWHQDHLRCHSNKGCQPACESDNCKLREAHCWRLHDRRWRLPDRNSLILLFASKCAALILFTDNHHRDNTMQSRSLILNAKDIESIEGERRVHFLNPNAERICKSLGDAVGLNNIGVHLIIVEPGKDTTEYHKHYYEEECIYVLSGSGTLVVEGESFQFEKGDFVGFPANTAAHSLKNTGSETLVFLVMGQRLEQDVADYPNQKKRLYRNSGRWELVEIANITDPR